MKQKPISELEQLVMNIIWTKKNSSVKDVVEALQKEKKLAYTTVATILQRLFSKGLVTRKEHKFGYIYSPKLSKEKYSKNIARTFLDKFVDSFGDIAIASFAESIDKLPGKKREYFLKLLEENDKSK
ncbi:MAG: BlaI/MecI/CopY family transcriptional regulator [Candidatus Levybacteria bacterium]|nr:BlaI/MecI/CopY family transcriptional regulator [Candidatus Levybacteria bacterium]